MITPMVNDALDEVSFLKRDCMTLVEKSLALYTPANGSSYPDEFRMIITPFLYAIWERCFTTNFGIMAKLVLNDLKNPSSLSPTQAALWLQAEPFFDSFVAKIREENSTGRRKIIRKRYNALTEFIEKYRKWEYSKMNQGIDVGTLVMTFSNVNNEVLQLNAEAIGLDLLPEFSVFKSKIKRLDELVGRRNDIGHGTMNRPPQNREFNDLVNLTKDHLISDFCELVQIWIIFRKCGC